MDEDTKKESWSGREIRLACEHEREAAKMDTQHISTQE